MQIFGDFVFDNLWSNKPRYKVADPLRGIVADSSEIVAFGTMLEAMPQWAIKSAKLAFSRSWCMRD